MFDVNSAVRTRPKIQLMDPLSLLRDVLTKVQYFSQPFFMCLSLVLLFDRYASTFGMLDHPDERKRHGNPVPLVGGPAIYLAISFSIVVLVPHSITALFLAIGGLVLILGLLDDRFDLTARHRIVAQLVIAWLTVAYAGVEIHRIGNLVGFGAFELGGAFSVVFSVICIVGVINAFNMIDGVDGLAGGIALVSFSGIGVLCFFGDFGVGARISMIFVGALTAFMCFNSRLFLPKARVFLGDSGSTLIGFSLAWFFISLTQSDDRYVSPIVAGWLFGIPLIDTISVMVRRISRGVSPMTGGRDHLHHRLIDAGWSVNRTVISMLTAQAALVGTGVLANGYSSLEPVLFISFVVIVMAYHWLMPAAIRRIKKHHNAPPVAVPTDSAAAVSIPVARPRKTTDIPSPKVAIEAEESST